MNLHEFTTLQTLALTFPLVVVCFLVLYECNKNLWQCIRHEDGISNRMCWMIYGIFFSFAGKIIESVWWFIPWTAKYINHPAWDKLNSFGVYINLPFRQIFFSAAAYCYLRAFLSPSKGGKIKPGLNWTVVISFIIGQLFIVGLYYAKQGQQILP